MCLNRTGYTLLVTSAPHPSSRPAIQVTPPLTPGEVDFLAGFVPAGAPVRRVWPGQPSGHSPWRPALDGSGLDLDVEAAEASPETVAPWLRFLVQEFLAPSSTRALMVALGEGLRGGHLVSGLVLVGGVREIRVDHSRTSERVLVTEYDAVVLQLDAWRRVPRAGVVRTGSGRRGRQTCV